MDDRARFLIAQFARIGAQLELGVLADRGDRPYALDVVPWKKQERFFLAVRRESQLTWDVPASSPEQRHLLFLIRHEKAPGRVEKHRYLCGHDERAWFVAAVPDAHRGVTDIRSAMEALMPETVQESLHRSGERRKNAFKRKNLGYLRQGEWFFVPSPSLQVRGMPILSREPLRRGGGKPHLAEQLVRIGGITVYVSRTYPDGVEQADYDRLIRQNPALAKLPWRVMRRDPAVYCRGRVTHPDHATLYLAGWHRALSNTESSAPWMRQMAFLD